MVYKKGELKFSTVLTVEYSYYVMKVKFICLIIIYGRHCTYRKKNKTLVVLYTLTVRYCILLTHSYNQGTGIAEQSPSPDTINYPPTHAPGVGVWAAPH